MGGGLGDGVRRLLGIWAASAAWATAAPALAQQMPGLPNGITLNPALDPERIIEQQRRELEERAAPGLPATGEPTVTTTEAAEGAAPTAPQVRFRLTAVRFDPSAYLSEAELQAIAQPLVGREVGFADVQAIVEAVNRLYRQRGAATARAVLPAQDIEDGVVQIRLVEGRIGTVTAQGGSSASGERARRVVGIAPGALADPQLLELRLRRFNLVNDTQLRAQRQPGQAFGTTDLALLVEEPPRFGGELFADNNGFEATGELQAGAVARVYRLLGDSDSLTAVGVASRGVTTGSLAYGLVLPNAPVRLGVSASRGSTRVRSGALGDLDVRGISTSVGAEASTLLFVTGSQSLIGSLALRRTISTTRVEGEELVDNRTTTASLGFSYSYAVPGFTAGITHELVVARVDEKMSGLEQDALLLRSSLLLVKLVAPLWQARLRGDLQATTEDELPGVLEYQIGGARSVRAYQPGIAAGDRGLSVSAELGRTFAFGQSSIEPFLFADHAQLSSLGNTFSLQAVGVGLNLAYRGRLSFRAHYAHGIGHHGLPDGEDRAFASLSVRY